MILRLYPWGTRPLATFVSKKFNKICNLHDLLLTSISISDSHLSLIIVLRLNTNTIRNTDFVRSLVSFADRSSFIIFTYKSLGEKCKELTCLLTKFLHKRKYSYFDRGNLWCESHHDFRCSLFSWYFIICITHGSECKTREPDRWLNNIGNIFRVIKWIKIRKILF